jgi:metal-dependent HD superfamily phosphatase/phosphodiesterase
MVASLRLHDDGVEVYVDCHAHQNKALVEEIVGSVLSAIDGSPTVIDRKRDDWVRVVLGGNTGEARRLAPVAVEAGNALLLGKGLHRVR